MVVSVFGRVIDGERVSLTSLLVAICAWPTRITRALDWPSIGSVRWCERRGRAGLRQVCCACCVSLWCEPACEMLR